MFEKYVHIRISNKKNQHQTSNIIHIQRVKQNDTNIQSFAISIVKMIKIEYACKINTNTHTCRFINNKQTVAVALRKAESAGCYSLSALLYLTYLEFIRRIVKYV